MDASIPLRATPPDDIDPYEFFTRWVPERVARDADRGRRLGDTLAVLEFHLEASAEDEMGGVYSLEIEGGAVAGRPGSTGRADLEIRLDVATWRRLNSGVLSAPDAFLKRHVRLKGNLALALKLHLILG